MPLAGGLADLRNPNEFVTEKVGLDIVAYRDWPQVVPLAQDWELHWRALLERKCAFCRVEVAPVDLCIFYRLLRLERGWEGSGRCLGRRWNAGGYDCLSWLVQQAGDEAKEHCE